MLLVLWKNRPGQSLRGAGRGATGGWSGVAMGCPHSLAITTIWASAHKGKLGLIDGLSKKSLHTKNGMILGWGLGKKTHLCKK